MPPPAHARADIHTVSHSGKLLEESNPEDLIEGPRVLMTVYWASLQAAEACLSWRRNLLILDACHLKSQYGGQVKDGTDNVGVTDDAAAQTQAVLTSLLLCPLYAQLLQATTVDPDGKLVVLGRFVAEKEDCSAYCRLLQIVMQFKPLGICGAEQEQQ